jgi:aspartate kinase
MGKTTNALEELARRASVGNDAEAWAQLDYIRQMHLATARDLLSPANLAPLENGWAKLWDDLERTIKGILLLRDFPPRFYDYIMAFGELFSSHIVSAYLLQHGVAAQLIDAREVIRTDSSFQKANVLADATTGQIRSIIGHSVMQGKVPVVQGFIGTDPRGYTTTLGREGSDYTAALVAAALTAERVVIWKDVPGVMNADPKRQPDAQLVPSLTYTQAVEMTFYGATVIHPKTIRPLRNAGIPLHVKSYVSPAAHGTVIAENLPPATLAIQVWRTAEVLISLRPLDFSFIDETRMRNALHQAGAAGLQVHLVQQTAIQLFLVVQHDDAAVSQFTARVSDEFEIATQHGLQLVTVLNPTPALAAPANAVLAQQQVGLLQYVLPTTT